MSKRPYCSKPLANEQLRDISPKHDGAERALKPEEVGLTEEMMREAQVESQSSKLTGPQKLDALRALIGTTTEEKASASMAAYEAKQRGNCDGYGEDPTPLDDFLREQDERRFMEQRDASVTDSDLVARMNSAPDMGGAVIAANMERMSTEPRDGDVRSLEPTPLMTEAEKAARYKAGRFAEMTDRQAGLCLLPPNPGPSGTLEQWLAWRQELTRYGPETAGVDVESGVADEAIARLRLE